ncbi:MAG TPA: CotH kinase family protein [Paludibacter sp.]|nr:CotH kinase family protein [Paludibacter sp.]
MKTFHLPIAILLFCLGLGSANAQVHWESIVIESDTWKYLAATSEPAPDWNQPGFGDAAWKSGAGGIGYGDNDDATAVSACNSLYLRTQFSLPDVSLVKDLLLDIDYDDAFVLYINGVECARSSNITAAAPAYNSSLSVDHEARMYSGGSPERFQLKTSSLVKGTNVVAVQVLNQSIGSSDLSARVFVQAKINYATTLYHETPSWFAAPVVGESNLPLVFISTNGQSILQNTKITADMRVLNSPTGINYSNDSVYEYNNKIGIEVRGNTSATYSKKSFTVETRNPDGSSLSVGLMGLPKENDWVFHGPYPDKSLMRNALAYHLGNLTGKWSPRTHFFELYIDNVYNGVYTLVEKIKIDKNRLDLAKLTPSDTLGDQLTGGYVMKLDRPEATDVEGTDYWISPYKAPTSQQQSEYFLFHYPKGDKLTASQRAYIKNHITAFEDAMYSDSYADRAAGYYPYVDLQSFVDYYIITELSRNLDGYRISTFMYKDKDSKGGKLTMGPFWDYDISFGNANFFSAGNTEGWVVDGMGEGDWYSMPFWWQKFRLDPYFNSLLKQRWNSLKANCINTTFLNAFIDSCAYDLRDAQVRNFSKWDILNSYVWPNNYVGGSYANELAYLKNWLRDRITWMDGQIQPIPDITGLVGKADGRIIDLATYPNPFTNAVNFKYYLPHGGKVEITINDMLGRQVFHCSETAGPGINTLPVAIGNGNPSSFYIYQVLVDGKPYSTGKLLRQ